MNSQEDMFFLEGGKMDKIFIVQAEDGWVAMLNEQELFRSLDYFACLVFSIAFAEEKGLNWEVIVSDFNRLPPPPLY
jgi:hypothetical protein